MDAWNFRSMPKAQLIKTSTRSGTRTDITKALKTVRLHYKTAPNVEKPSLLSSRPSCLIMLNALQMTLLESRLDSGTRPNRPLNKMAPLPPINLIITSLPNQLIPAQLRQHNRPHNPIDSSTGDDPPPHHAVQVIRQRLVHANAISWGNERRDHEVDVAGEEENRHGQGCAEGRVPVVLGAVRVEPD
jgi:hypothetical protein